MAEERMKIQRYYDTLSRYYSEYYNADKKKKRSIENSVLTYSSAIDSDIYIKLNEGAASGLFRHGFFESDLSSSISILKKMLEETEE